MKRATKLSRFAALFIDTYLSIVLTIILIFFLINWTEDSVVLSSILSIIIIILGMAAFLCKDAIDGRSIGKSVFNLGIRELDFSIPSTKHLIKRNLTSIFWPKDFYNILFGNDKRRQGDIKYGLDVYHLNNPTNLAAKIFRIVISICIIAFLVVSGFLLTFKEDTSYKTAIRYIQENKDIQEIVGDHITFGFFPSGSISRSNGHGEAFFKLKVKGEKQTLTLFITLSKEPNKNWKVKTVRY